MCTRYIKSMNGFCLDFYLINSHAIFVLCKLWFLLTRHPEYFKPQALLIQDAQPLLLYTNKWDANKKKNMGWAHDMWH